MYQNEASPDVALGCCKTTGMQVTDLCPAHGAVNERRTNLQTHEIVPCQAAVAC